MPFNIKWFDDEQTLIVNESAGNWTWDEYYAAINTMLAMMNSVPHRVDTINLSGRGARTPSGSMLTHFSRAASMMPSNHGITVVVASTSFAKVMVGVSRKLYSGYLTLANIVFVTSIEEAHSVIGEKRLSPA